jgi:hypothetical protein
MPAFCAGMTVSGLAKHDCVFGVVTALGRPKLFWMATTAERSRAAAKAHARRPGGGRDRPKPRRDAVALDAQLDLALEHTFPASDPVSVGGATGTEPPSRPVDRQAPDFDPPGR